MVNAVLTDYLCLLQEPYQTHTCTKYRICGFIIKVIYSPTNAQVVVLKTILKFTLKQLRHVSVQSHHLQGAHYPCLLKLHFVKIVSYGTPVCD